MGGVGIIIGLIVWVISILIIILIIRYAIDSSKTSKKMDDLIFELQMLRKDIKDNKHIIDKKI